MSWLMPYPCQVIIACTPGDEEERKELNVSDGNTIARFDQ